MCAAKRYVRFTPNSDRKSDIPQKAMSALPPKADMCGANEHVCFGPIADIDRRWSLFEHLVGASEQRRWNFEPKALCCLLVDRQIELCWHLDWQIAGLGTL
jgi:hypothetical protein